MSKSDKLKILFVPGWYPTAKDKIYGIFVKEHAKAVSLYDDVVVLYNERGDRKYRRLWEVFSDQKEDGIRTIRIKHKEFLIPKISYFIYLFSTFVSFRKIVTQGWRPDIIHVHGLSAALPGVMLGMMYHLPFVITEHWTGFPRQSLRFIDKLNAKFTMNKANLILPVSKDLGEAIKAYGIKSKFEVIPNVVDTKLFCPRLNKSKKKTDGKKRILLVALLIPRKGISYLFEALASLKKKRQDFVLNIVGEGPSRKEYEELSDKLALTGFVKFYGTKAKTELAEIMRSCDFFVLPSLSENLPCVLIEAAASGLPLIATDVGGVSEIINESNGILIPSKDIKSLETSITYMLDHYQNYCSKTLYEYAKTNYGFEAVGKNLNQIYKHLKYDKN
jgi:glycosyltransferase involved in cell wall biosynthesis